MGRSILGIIAVVVNLMLYDLVSSQEVNRKIYAQENQLEICKADWIEQKACIDWKVKRGA